MKRAVYSILFVLVAFSAGAAIKLPAIFGDNMMLQQNQNTTLWGWSERGATITITASWSGRTFTARAGTDGKWRASIPTPAASYTPHTIIISDSKDGRGGKKLENILVGEVWLGSGQSNMEMPMKGFLNQPVEGANDAVIRSGNKNIRLITVKRSWSFVPNDDFTGEWKEATPLTVRDFSATGYFFGKMLNDLLDVPVGLILSSWGGSNIEAWMSKQMLTGFAEIALPEPGSEVKVPNRTPMVLYNAMIAPIVGYTIRGAIWYQGESNYERAAGYSALFEKMVKEWRVVWGQGEFPFYYCQIAPYDYVSIATPEFRGSKFNSAFLREAQYNSATRIPNSGMAVLMDIGEQDCIHPRNKRAGGERLAAMALAGIYGIQGFAFESPTYDSMSIDGNKVLVSFKNAKLGFTSYGKELKNFEVAGSDRVFYSAKAAIVRGGVEVRSDKVARPVAVRYAFKDFVVGDLFSTEGLPVSSFRTDTWDE